MCQMKLWGKIFRSQVHSELSTESCFASGTYIFFHYKKCLLLEENLRKHLFSLIICCK